VQITKQLLAMKTFFAKSAVVIALAVLGGCSEQPAENVVIRGSNTVGEELAPRLLEEYSKVHPGVRCEMEFKGTSYGIGALLLDKCDIAATSRAVTTNDIVLAKDRNIEFEDHPIGSYSVAVVVNANNPVSNLSREQVHDLFTGKIKNWNEVGGPDAPVNLYIRNPISGTHLGFQELAMGTNAYALAVKTFVDYGALSQAVAKDPNGIGYSSFNTAKKAGAKLVSIDNITPTEENVQKQTYPYARPLHLYTSKGTAKKAALDFIGYVTSANGQKVVAEADFIPHK
jgi:phosphate transport system substrate-binding protein